MEGRLGRFPQHFKAVMPFEVSLKQKPHEEQVGLAGGNQKRESVLLRQSIPGFQTANGTSTFLSCSKDLLIKHSVHQSG